MNTNTTCDRLATIDKDCSVWKCVTDKGLTHCGECGEYLCEMFMLRKGMSLEEANKQQGDYFRKMNTLIICLHMITKQGLMSI